MALIRRLDNYDDWCFGRGKADYANKNDGVAFNVKTRLREWKYNWFNDYERGIDWRTRLGSKTQKIALDSDIKQVIEETEGVLSIRSLESSLNVSDRSYTASISIDTIYGEELQLDIKIGG